MRLVRRKTPSLRKQRAIRNNDKSKKKMTTMAPPQLQVQIQPQEFSLHEFLLDLQEGGVPDEKQLMSSMNALPLDDHQPLDPIDDPEEMMFFIDELIDAEQFQLQEEGDEEIMNALFDESVFNQTDE